jgi:hypothetical protein
MASYRPGDAGFIYAPIPVPLRPIVGLDDRVPVHRYILTLVNLRIPGDTSDCRRLCYLSCDCDQPTWCDEGDVRVADELLRAFPDAPYHHEPVRRLDRVWFLPAGMAPSLSVLGGYQVLHSPHYDQPMFATLDDRYVWSRFAPAGVLQERTER